MEIGSFPSACLLLSLILIGQIVDGRTKVLPGDYWESVMNGEPMPKAIADLFHHNSGSDKHRFIKDLDSRPHVIIYHSHHHQRPNPSGNTD